MSLLNRKLQHAVLQHLIDRAAFELDFTSWFKRDEHADACEVPIADWDGVLTFNLKYLEQHGLIGLQKDPMGQVARMKITARGVDFMEDDGGLSAILRVVTIKLHADTIRDILAAKVMESDAPPEEKSVVVSAIRGASEEVIKNITVGLAEKGLENLPDALHWLSKLIGL